MMLSALDMMRKVPLLSVTLRQYPTKRKGNYKIFINGKESRLAKSIRCTTFDATTNISV
jgi:hypothetical protein